jgi:hypothetical protein
MRALESVITWGGGGVWAVNINEMLGQCLWEEGEGAIRLDTIGGERKEGREGQQSERKRKKQE